ncbi:DUF1552 domain-containing protein [Polyangium aurulentum]|uniref:DUF1552 domain-containing protein n=1 Tax=Polyangium aurulentum TaxID=2567896 RepID=UPI0010AE41AE|nr:DUF1552 domain-containing protein [Polyangium aurulentum]UQA56076.1 DUF1552 domain-containing protein [Polyangium aurulentum]
MIHKPKMSRRAWLGGAGVVLALPFLEYFAPRTARAEISNIRRLITFYVPNGIDMKSWTPTAEGANYELSPILKPLENVKDKLLVLTGIENAPARPDGPGDHAAGTGSFLTCRHVIKFEDSSLKNGISMDQVAAEVLGKDTPFKSLQLGTDGGSSAGDCDSGYSCAYSRNISWASETQPLPKIVKPEVVWDMLFLDKVSQGSPEEIERRKLYRKSILDSVLGQANGLSGRLGSADRMKLDEYMTSVRELELKIEKGAGAVCMPPNQPPDSYSYEEHVDLMIDLMAAAMQCDSTRVVSFMLGNAGSGRSYPFIDVPEAHHELSHHQGDPAKQAKLAKIDTWEVSKLARLLEKLNTITDAQGNPLLDTTAVFFSSEIEDGDAHRHSNLPVLLAGSAGGAFKTGRHVTYADKPPMANLFISILNAMGVDISTFGDNGTGPISNLS